MGKSWDERIVTKNDKVKRVIDIDLVPDDIADGDIQIAKPDDEFKQPVTDQKKNQHEQMTKAKQLIKFQKNCATCKIVRKDPRLRKRVHVSSNYIPHGEKAINIFRDINSSGIKLSYTSWMNHLKKHDPPTGTVIGKELAKELIKKKVQIERRDLVSELDADPEKFWRTVIAEGSLQLKEGNLAITMEHILKASKDLTDYLNKKDDQQLKIAGMIWQYASGADGLELLEGMDEEYSITYGGKYLSAAELKDTAEKFAEGTADDSGEGEVEPDSVHQRAAGDASASWPSALRSQLPT